MYVCGWVVVVVVVVCVCVCVCVFKINSNSDFVSFMELPQPVGQQSREHLQCSGCHRDCHSQQSREHAAPPKLILDTRGQDADYCY